MTATATGKTRNRRRAIFLAVCVGHGLIVWLILHASRSTGGLATPVLDSLLLLALPREAPKSAAVAARGDEVRAPGAEAAAPRVSNPPKRPSAAADGAAPAQAPGTAAVAAPPQAPKIDWDQELELAAKTAATNAATNAARENAYRDLAALSPDQLAWVRQNHLEAAAPGIPWKYRRVEIVEGGLPIIHINDHCVAIPFLMMMVFCKIGHIEANGKLFEHLRDVHEP